MCAPLARRLAGLMIAAKDVTPSSDRDLHGTLPVRLHKLHSPRPVFSSTSSARGPKPRVFTSQGRSASFTRPPRLHFVSPSLRRVTQSTSSRPLRQPPPIHFFFNFPSPCPALNSGNVPHLARIVNPSIQTFTSPRPARFRSRGSHTTYHSRSPSSTPRRARCTLGSCGANSIIPSNRSVKGLQRTDFRGSRLLYIPRIFA